MTVILFHEIDPASLDDILQNGIKRKTEGDKTDSERRKTDNFLDTHLPDWTRDQHLCRGNVVYGYLPAGEDKIIDIQSGEAVPVDDYVAARKQVLLRIKANEDYCWVSDLDMYDTLLRALELDEMDSTREHLADRYWERVVPFKKYQPGSILRPEVLIASSIRPEDIELVKK